MPLGQVAVNLSTVRVVEGGESVGVDHRIRLWSGTGSEMIAFRD